MTESPKRRNMDEMTNQKESAQRALAKVQQARYEQTKRLQATSVRRPIPQPRVRR